MLATWILIHVLIGVHVFSLTSRLPARVTLIRDNFLDVNPSDDRVKRLKVALLSAECSRTGVSNPVNFIVNEGEGERVH